MYKVVGDHSGIAGHKALLTASGVAIVVTSTQMLNTLLAHIYTLALNTVFMALHYWSGDIANGF